MFGFKIIYVLVMFYIIPGNLGNIENKNEAEQLQVSQFFLDPLNFANSNCTWRPLKDAKQECPYPDINFYYYSDDYLKKKINPTDKNSLLEINWDPEKHNIILIHGYGGGVEMFPNYILRDAYIKNGSYNLFVVDWKPLAEYPCYSAAINNMKSVAQCTALLFKNLRSQGIPSNSVTCVGHDLGAHICGSISNFVDFRIRKIIGLDPAGQMIPNSYRLRAGLADNVQVIHTNAGKLGDSTSSGRLNVCINGGKVQKLCEGISMDFDLCSHILAICYMAESIDDSTARKAQPCSRQCPFGPRKSLKAGQTILIGQHTPHKASGSYCVVNNEPPFCSINNPKGHRWCCLDKITT